MCAWGYDLDILSCVYLDNLLVQEDDAYGTEPKPQQERSGREGRSAAARPSSRSELGCETTREAEGAIVPCLEVTRVAETLGNRR